LYKRQQYLRCISHNAQIGNLEDGFLRISIDGDEGVEELIATVALGDTIK